MQKVTIYTRPFCGYCSRALALLQQKNADVTEISAAFEPEKRQEMLARSNGKTTYPQIFVGETHVGGHDELMALERAGSLDRLLRGE